MTIPAGTSASPEEKHTGDAPREDPLRYGRRYRAMSIRQPCADLIMSGRMAVTGQTVDNRPTSTAYRGILVVHAAARWDPAAAQLADDLGLHDDAESGRYTRGFLGTVRLVDVHPVSCCCAPWGIDAPGMFHWVLQDPRWFTSPIAGIGKRGVFWTPVLPLPADDLPAPRIRDDEGHP